MTAADCWADLEAKAAVEKLVERLILTACELGAMQGSTVATRVAAGMAAAALRDPAVTSILKLIEAARHSQPGAEGGVVVPVEWLEQTRSICATIGMERHPLTEGQRRVLAQTAGDLATMIASPQQPATSTDEKVGR